MQRAPAFGFNPRSFPQSITSATPIVQKYSNQINPDNLTFSYGDRYVMISGGVAVLAGEIAPRETPSVYSETQYNIITPIRFGVTVPPLQLSAPGKYSITQVAPRYFIGVTLGTGCNASPASGVSVTPHAPDDLRTGSASYMPEVSFRVSSPLVPQLLTDKPIMSYLVLILDEQTPGFCHWLGLFTPRDGQESVPFECGAHTHDTATFRDPAVTAFSPLVPPQSCTHRYAIMVCALTQVKEFNLLMNDVMCPGPQCQCIVDFVQKSDDVIALGVQYVCSQR